MKITDLPPPEFEPDHLVIRHTKFGLERFTLKNLRFNLHQSNHGKSELVFFVQSAAPILRSSQQAGLSGDPWFELTMLLSNPVLTKGAQFRQLRGYDLDHGHLTNFYYFTHESIDDATAEIVDTSPSGIEVKLSGTVLINGPTVDAKFAIHAHFIQDEGLHRGVE